MSKNKKIVHKDTAKYIQEYKKRQANAIKFLTFWERVKFVFGVIPNKLNH